MTRFLLLTIFLLHYGPVYAGWLAMEKQYQPIGLETLYFDPETIHRNGIRVTLWQLTDLKWNNTTRFLSTKTHKEVDCEDPRVRVLQVMEFSPQMGTGWSKPDYIETGSWQPVEERSVNHAFWKAAYRNPYSTTKASCGPVPRSLRLRRRSREKTRTDAVATASDRSLCFACSRSRPRSDPR
jgi:hypothetical protein